MISENLDGERGAIEVMSSGFKSMDNRKEFVVIDIIISFCWGIGLGKVQTGMPFAIQVGLEEDGA